MVKSNWSFRKQITAYNLLLPLLAIILGIGCNTRESDDKLFVKTFICNSFWREKFRVFSGGAYSAELYSDYITDSTNFRMHVGTHDEYSSFDYVCNGDSLTIRKFKHQDGIKIPIEQSVYSLSGLRKNHKFDEHQ